MKKNRYYFTVHERVEAHDAFDGYEVRTDWGWDEHPGYVLEDAAEEYESNCDGWESDWPIDFYIYNGQGECLGCAQVNREFYPSFYSGTVRDKNGEIID